MQTYETTRPLSGHCRSAEYPPHSCASAQLRRILSRYFAKFRNSHITRRADELRLSRVSLDLLTWEMSQTTSGRRPGYERVVLATSESSWLRASRPGYERVVLATSESSWLRASRPGYERVVLRRSHRDNVERRLVALVRWLTRERGCLRTRSDYSSPSLYIAVHRCTSLPIAAHRCTSLPIAVHRCTSLCRLQRAAARG